jgi:hypothetical protein
MPINFMFLYFFSYHVIVVSAHKKLRSSCQTCTLPEGLRHNDDTDRFHHKGSFVRTHCTTVYSRTYGVTADYCRRKWKKG